MRHRQRGRGGLLVRDPVTGQRFSPAEMVDQVAIFFLAGHETSASALAWALWLSTPLALLGVALYVGYLNRFQIRPEERVLEERFGTRFTSYCATVRRWL